MQGRSSSAAYLPDSSAFLWIISLRTKQASVFSDGSKVVEGKCLLDFLVVFRISWPYAMTSHRQILLIVPLCIPPIGPPAPSRLQISATLSSEIKVRVFWLLALLCALLIRFSFCTGIRFVEVEQHIASGGPSNSSLLIFLGRSIVWKFAAGCVSFSSPGSPCAHEHDGFGFQLHVICLARPT